MTDEQIKQNAGRFASRGRGAFQTQKEYELLVEGYIAGAHSRDEEIKELQKDNLCMESLLSMHRKMTGEYELKLHKLRNPWISVEERLPQLNKICFGMRDGKMPRICMLVKKKNGECVFNTPNEEYEYPKGKITHWMPIPKLEKE